MAKWIPIKPTTVNNFMRFQCSECKMTTIYDYAYCPHCGKKIVGYEEEEHKFDMELEFSKRGIEVRFNDKEENQ